MRLPERLDLVAIERALCAASFADFVRLAWPQIIPDRLKWGWHMDAVCDHLSAVAAGQINRLLVNVPPGTSKSTLIGVMYPAWLWGPGGKPHHRYIGASHEQGLAVRDSRMMRELVTSPWYQERWPLALKGDQNEKLYFENDSKGFRQACAVGSMTGRRGHCLAPQTLIATTEGVKTIQSIAESASDCYVVSYDIHSGKLVQRPVVAVARGSSKDLYRVHFASGRVVECSGDHRFYTDRGYVEARLLSKGDIGVRLLRPSVHQDRGGREEVVRQDGRADVLQSVLLDQSPECAQREDRTVLHSLPKEDSERSKELLRGMQERGFPQGRRENSRSTHIDSMRELSKEFFFSSVESKEVLFSHLRFSAPRDVHCGRQQSWLERWNRQAAASPFWLPAGLDEGEGKSAGSRRWEVRRLRIGNLVACPSHRCEPQEQRPAQPSGSLPEVPLPLARGAQIETVSDPVALVERLCRDGDTYDLQVLDTNCFFANGILVHNCIAWDDPLSPAKASSKPARDEAIRILTETVPTRLNDPIESSIIIVMQRVHEKDPSGYIITEGLGYDHLCIPMEFEPKRRTHTSIGWTDPRTEDGELLDPVRFPQEVIDRDKKAMGSYAWAGQMQQRPSPLGGGMFRGEWWRYYDVLPAVSWRGIWGDTAQKTAEANDYSVFQCWGAGEDGAAILIDQIRGKWEAPELLANVRAFWAKHKASQGVGPLRSLNIEDKVSGTGLIQTLKREGVPVQGIQRGAGRDKVTRAMDAIPSIEAGLVRLPRVAPWLSDFLEETAAFPKGTHDDQVDPLCDAVSSVILGAGQKFFGMLTRT